MPGVSLALCFFDLFLFVGFALALIGEQVSIQTIQYVDVVDFIDQPVKVFAYLGNVHSSLYVALIKLFN